MSQIITKFIANAAVTDAKVATGINATKIGAGTVDNTEFGYLDGVTSSIQTQLNAKLSTTLTSAHIFVGNGSNVATDVAVSGDLTLANTGAFTIANNAVTTAKINNDAVTSAKISITYGGTLSPGAALPADGVMIKDSGAVKRTVMALANLTAYNGLDVTYTTNTLVVSPGQAAETFAAGSAIAYDATIPGGGADVSSGDTSLASGPALYAANTAVTTGKLVLETGLMINSAATVTTGAVKIASGSTYNSTVTALAAGTTGSVTVKSGDSTDTSGDLVLAVGAAATRGKLRLQPTASNTVGHVFTATDTSGAGTWQANPGTGAITSLTGDVTATGPGAAAATIANNAVSNAKFRQSAALSVVGNATNATANVADISAASDFQIMRRSGTALAFGAIDLSQANAVGTSILSVANGGTSLATLTANNVILGNGTSAPTFVAPGTSGNVLTSNGTTWTSAAPSAAAINNKETFVLSGTDITNQYLDLAHVAKTGSINFMVKGAGSLLEGASYDYTVSYTGGAGGNTRITFQNDLATGGAAALVATDVVQVQYQY